VGRAAVIGFIYSVTYESTIRTINYNMTNLTIPIIVVLTEFLAYSIATYGGVSVWRGIGKK